MKTITSFRNFVMASFVMSLIPVLAYSEPFTTGNLIVSRIGDGSAVLAGAATAVFLDEYTPAGVLVQSVALPTVAADANNPFFITGTANTEGTLNLSTNKRYLLLGGYKSGIASGGLARVVARIDNNAVINTTTAITDFGISSFRAVVSTNGTDLWVATMGGTGVNYCTLGSTTSTVLLSANSNVRGLGIFNDQLYFCTALSNVRFSSVGIGLPTTGGITPAMLIPNASITAPNAFTMLDLSADVPGMDVMYVAEDIYSSATTANPSKGLTKYSLVDGVWTKTGAIAHASGLRDVKAVLTPNGVVVYVVTQTGTPQVLSITDNSGYNGTLTGNFPTLPLITSGTNTAIRGISFAPEAIAPAAPTSVVATAGNAQVLLAFTVDNGGSQITNFTVTPYIGTTAGTPQTGTSNPFIVTGLTNNTTYTFKVMATNVIGNSPMSSASNDVTPSVPNALGKIKSNLNVCVSNNEIKVNAQSGEIIEVINAVGKRLINRTAIDGENIIKMNTKGVLIVKVGNKFAKITL